MDRARHFAAQERGECAERRWSGEGEPSAGPGRAGADLKAPRPAFVYLAPTRGHPDLVMMSPRPEDRWPEPRQNLLRRHRRPRRTPHAVPRPACGPAPHQRSQRRPGPRLSRPRETSDHRAVARRLAHSSAPTPLRPRSDLLSPAFAQAGLNPDTRPCPHPHLSSTAPLPSPTFALPFASHTGPFHFFAAHRLPLSSFWRPARLTSQRFCDTSIVSDSLRTPFPSFLSIVPCEPVPVPRARTASSSRRIPAARCV